MTNLAICKKCRALTADTDEDIAEHRRKHTEDAADIERARKAASEATTALKELRAVVRDYESALEQRTTPLEPEQISMRVVEDDEDDEGEAPDIVGARAADDEDDFDDDDEEEDDVTPTPATAHVNATPSGYQPAIDRDDDDPFA